MESTSDVRQKTSNLATMSGVHRARTRAATWKENAVSNLHRSRKNEDDEGKGIAYHGIDDQRAPEDQRLATMSRRESDQELRKRYQFSHRHGEKDDDKKTVLLPSSFRYSTTIAKKSKAHQCARRNPRLEWCRYPRRYPLPGPSLQDALIRSENKQSHGQNREDEKRKRTAKEKDNTAIFSTPAKADGGRGITS
jgi:hypothetical protein